MTTPIEDQNTDAPAPDAPEPEPTLNEIREFERKARLADAEVNWTVDALSRVAKHLEIRAEKRKVTGDDGETQALHLAALLGFTRFAAAAWPVADRRFVEQVAAGVAAHLFEVQQKQQAKMEEDPPLIVRGGARGEGRLS